MIETTTSFDLQKHRAEEHKVSPLSTYLKEIVYGGNDGIVTTFAVVAGFAGAGGGAAEIAGYSYLTVLLFGFANLFADASSMGLGNFLSSRSEKDLYRSFRQKELHEIRTNPQMERAETIEILQQKGFTPQQSADLATIYATNEQYWLEFMMKDELEMQNPEGDNAALMALATFLSFLVFGFIPLVPYVFFSSAGNIFFISVGATFVALLLLGLLRWKVTNQGVIRSVGEVILLGGVSAGIAYAVGMFFKV